MLPFARQLASMDGMQKRTIHTILAELLEEAHMRPTELSARTGIPQSTISRILHGKIKVPKDDPVRRIANYFGITTDELRGHIPLQRKSGPGTPSTSASDAGETVHGSNTYPFSLWEDDAPLGNDEVVVPFLREAELAAGDATAVREATSHVRFNKKLLLQKGVKPEAAFMCPVTGNSMEPILRNGSTVGVDRSRTEIVDGDLYAVDHSGQLRVKQLYRLPGGGIRMRSFNREDHPDEEYRQDEIRDQKIRILGRVFCYAAFL